MLVSDFLEQLSLGPLSNLSISGEGDGTIVPAKRPMIINHLNDALLRIYTKFNLSEKELILSLLAYRTKYRLESQFAVSQAANYPTTIPHILDTAQPFKDDLLKVVSVRNVNGAYLPLNDDGVDRSLYTPEVNVLQVPDPVAGVPLFVTYQARHPKLETLGSDITKVNFSLPTILEAAALAYVAHKVYFNMNGQEHAAIAAGHLAEYNRICNDITDKDLVSQSISQTNTKFDDRGFV